MATESNALVQTAEASMSKAKSIAEDNSLFEIDRELNALLDKLEKEIEERGEAISGSVELFQQYCAAFGSKVDRIGRYIQAMESREAHCKAESNRLSARAKSAERRAKQTKSLVMYFLQSRGLSEMEGLEFTIRRWENSQDSVEVDDVSKLPSRFVRVQARYEGSDWERILAALPQDLKALLIAGIQSTSPINDAIKQERGFGIEVAGAKVERGHHIRVS